MAEKLLPCPFCGGEAEIRSQIGLFKVGCKRLSCKAERACWFTDKDEAIEDWHKRVYNSCSNCNGTGRVTYYEHPEETTTKPYTTSHGICRKCNGSGIIRNRRVDNGKTD